MEIVTPADYERGDSAKRRRRSGRPCDACRKRKTRCVAEASGHRPCVHCRLRGTRCTFEQRPPDRLPTSSPAAVSAAVPMSMPRRRALRPERQGGMERPMGSGMGRVRPPESMMRTIAPTETATAMVTPGLIHVSGAAEDGLGTTPFSSLSPASTSPESVGSETGTGTGTAQLLPPDDTPTLGLKPLRFGELYGIGSDMEPILMRHRPYDPFTQEFSLETHSIRRVLERDSNGTETVDYPLTFHMVSDERALAYDPGYAQADAIEACVRPHGPRLVELFWRHIQPCYPLLHRGVFMQQYEASSSSSSARKTLSAELLGAVYLSALRWWTYDPELSIRPMPDAARLRRLLHEALRAAYHRPKLSAIQAILLLLQCQPEDPLNPDHSYAWGLTCQALAVGQCLGLHLDASQWSIPAWERHLRKRLSWALFMQDRWTALAYGRPVHIHLDDWTVLPLTDADFADLEGGSNNNNTLTSKSAVVVDGGFDDRRSISATGKTQFVLMVRLAQILSTVLASFYTARTSLDQDTVLLYRRARPLFDQLQAWSASIPASLQMGISYQRKLSFHGHLHFSYYGVQIALLRRLIRSTALSPRCADDQVLSELRQLALHTVQSAIAFTFSLRPDQLEAFWYFTSPYFFSLVGSFTTLLLVTSLSSQERSFWQETLNSYLWHLRTMSKSSEPMRYAVNRLEGAILRGLEHALAVNLHEPVDDTVSPMMATDVLANSQAFATYTDFGDWDLAGSIDGAFDLLSAMDLLPLQGDAEGSQPR